MLIAGEPSGDLLAAELVAALREQAPDAIFFGAGGPKMSGAGVELVHEMSHLSLVGLTDVIAKLFELRRLMQKLLAIAIQRQPDAVIGVDYGGFNLRFGHALKRDVRGNPFSTWKPRIVQFVSPQVWASRPGRARQIAEDYDLLLSIFPFEKDWYAQRTPGLRVEFVGHPMVGRFVKDGLGFGGDGPGKAAKASGPPHILLLPGSRRSELKRHLPPMLAALEMVREKFPGARAKMVLPNEGLKDFAGPLAKKPADLGIQIGNLPQALAETDIALAKTGTVTMECAFFGVPAVTLYKGSWLNYQIARRIVTVETFTMPNLLAGEEVYPEFLQNDVTAERLAGSMLGLLQNEARRQRMKSQLAQVVASLGEPGAPKRAADAILSLLGG